MKRRIMLLLFAAGCEAAPPAEANAPGSGGEFEIHWTGVDTGEFSSTARAEWCEDGRLMEVAALRGDTGAAIVLYPLDSVVSDSMQVMEPGLADGNRPGATMALRIFGEVSVLGYQGLDGSVSVERDGPNRISGSFRANLQGIREAGPAEVEGRFEDVPVYPATLPCIADTVRISGDTALR